MDKPQHQVRLPELITDLISSKDAKDQKKPEEEVKQFEDAPEQSTVIRPKITVVVPRDPNKDNNTQECKENWNAADWDDSLPLPGIATNQEAE